MGSSGTDFRAVRDALWASQLPPLHRLVALRLVEHLPNVAPSIQSLASHTGLSRETVMRCIRDLEEAGCIRVSRRHGRRSEYALTGSWDGPSLKANQWLPDTSGSQTPVAPRHHTSGSQPPPPVAPSHPKQSRKAGKEAVGVPHVSPTADSSKPDGGVRVAPEEQGPAGRRKARRCALWHFVPDAWQPNDAHREKAHAQGWDAVRFGREVERFKSYEFKSPKSDADRAFHNWLSSARDGVPAKIASARPVPTPSASTRSAPRERSVEEAMRDFQ
jgi:biotin operon repressor